MNKDIKNTHPINDFFNKLKAQGYCGDETIKRLKDKIFEEDVENEKGEINDLH